MYVQGRRVPIIMSEFQSLRDLQDEGHLHDPIWAMAKNGKQIGGYLEWMGGLDLRNERGEAKMPQNEDRRPLAQREFGGQGTIRPKINSNDFGRFALFRRFEFEFCRRGNYFQIAIRFVVSSDLHLHVLWLVLAHVLMRCRHTVERKERDK